MTDTYYHAIIQTDFVNQRQKPYTLTWFDEKF